MVNPEMGEILTCLFKCLIKRVQKTVRGSADDIGWLQRDPEMPPVEDGTDRFDQILYDIRRDVHRLPDTSVYLLVPGLFSNHEPQYFVDTKKKFSELGLECHIMKIHSESSVENNAREIKDYIKELFLRGSKKRVVILGHSKGGIDAAAALSLYWPELKDKVVGLVFAQSPYGGNPFASDFLRKGQFGFRMVCNITMEVIKGDIKALKDLTYESRKQFLKNHPLPPELPTVSYRTEASNSPEDLATLSRVAKIPVALPVSAIMAAGAQLLKVKYGEKSDGVVTCCDAEVPGSVVVRPKRKLHHTWLVSSPVNEVPLEPDAAQVCEALFALVLQVEKPRRKHRNPKRVVLDWISQFVYVS